MAGVKNLRAQFFENDDFNEDETIAELLTLCATSNRGQSANLDHKFKIENAVSLLESQSPIANPGDSELLNGQWDLVYASEALTRTSPFFWSFRKAFEGNSNPVPLLPGELSEAIFAITDGLPFYTVGKVQQTISGVGTFGNQTLESSVQVTIRLFDALIPPQDGFVTTTSTFEASPADPSKIALTVQTTEVKKSTFAQIPVLGQIVETTKFPTKDVIEQVRPGSSQVMMELTYLSQKLRISRNENGQVFVFARSGGMSQERDIFAEEELLEPVDDMNYT